MKFCGFVVSRMAGPFLYIYIYIYMYIYCRGNCRDRKLTKSAICNLFFRRHFRLIPVIKFRFSYLTMLSPAEKVVYAAHSECEKNQRNMWFIFGLALCARCCHGAYMSRSEFGSYIGEWLNCRAFISVDKKIYVFWSDLLL